MNRIAAYLFGALFQPLSTIERLVADPRRARIGAVTMLAMSVLYLLVCVFLAALHGTPNPEPFLRIPSEDYFYWAQYFYIPVLLLGMILTGGVMYLLARTTGTQGSADDTFALTAFTTAVATFPILFHDLAITLVQILGLIDYRVWFHSVTHGGIWFYIAWIFLIAYCLYFLILYPIILKVVHRVSRLKAVVIGWFGFLVYQGFIFVFIR